MLWKNIEDKLNKSKRKWKPSVDKMSYRCKAHYSRKMNGFTE